jgi:hypothetical protein
VVLAAGLMAAAGLSHRIFLAAVVAIVLLAAALGAREARRTVAGGARARDTGPLREAAAALGGGALAAGVLAWIAAGPGLAVDTSQDGFFRRRGLRGLLVDRYRERFLGDLSRAAVPVIGGMLLGGVWASGPAVDTAGERFLRRLVSAWLAVTVAGVLILAATSAGPANRVLQFAFFLPLAAAAGVAVLGRRGRVGAWAGGAAVVVFVVVSLVGWSRQSPAFQPGELEAVRRAAEAIDPLPASTPLVFLVDTDEPAAAYHVTRFANVIRAGVDPQRIPDVRIAVGSPADALEGRPTLTGDPEHDAVARAYGANLESGAAILVLAPFHPDMEEARSLGTAVGQGVVVLGARVDADLRLPGPDPSIRGLDLISLVLFAPGALAALGLLGAGWAIWGLGRTRPRAALLAAPSAGIATIVLGTVGADRAGVTPGGGGSLAAVLVLALAGYALAARR